MFDSLARKFQEIRRKIFAPGYLTEKNIDEGLQEIRNALLEADANYRIVEEFIERVKQKAVGEKVLKSIAPGQQIVKIVSDELVALMGPTDTEIRTAPKSPTIIMMVGLQGSGKTTTCAKLANYLKGKEHRPLLVAADMQRPAAVEQLHILGESISVPVFSEAKLSPKDICKKSISFAAKNNCDTVIVDTAGRLHIDEQLMAELRAIQKQLKPQNVFLVTDAMTGQDAVNSAREFDAQLGLDGVILTKLDGDARGGAALSIRAVTGKPIKFIGVGEKMDRIEEFHPDRMASRILGMGDVVTLVEKVQETIEEEKAAEMQQKLLDATFSLEDFLDQLQAIKKMGSLQELLGMLPGGLGTQFQNMNVDEKQFVQVEAMIYSMTPEERQDPEILDGRRRNRVARGSGTTIQDVNMLLRQFREMRKLMRNMGKFNSMMGNMFPGMGLGIGKSHSHASHTKKRKSRR